MRPRGPGSYPAAAVSVALLVVASLTSCESEVPPPDPGFQYVALGDSYTSAPDLGQISSDGCHRSNRNYPHLVAAELDDATLIDVSCGGARTDAVLRSQVLDSERRVLPPQIAAVSADTDLITVGLGANDGGFVVTTVFGCLAMAPSDPRGSPCKDAFAAQIPRLLQRIRVRYVDVLEAIGRRAPEARILVIGYPRLLADSTGCPRRFPLATGDVGYAREAFDRLLDTIEAAAADADVEYVDVAAASEGHDICSDEPWINGQRADARTGAAPYHPTPEEQTAVAQLILARL